MSAILSFPKPHSASASPSLAVPAPDLRQAMRHLVGGVCVITAGTGVERTGATVTSAHSLSLDPEVMLVSLNLSSSTLPVVRRFGHYGVSILAYDQQPVADRFAGRGGLRGADRYEGADWTIGETGASLLSDALVSIDCTVERIVEHHSHALVFGTVRALRIGEGSPLVYSHGRYGHYPVSG